jgi:TLD
MEWALLGYDGPTLIAIKTTNNSVLGAFVGSVKWKSSKDFYGNSECFLFQLEPKLRICNTTGKNENFMYLNSEAFISPSQQALIRTNALPQGLGFGGDLDRPRLFISEFFDQCCARSWDKTFEPGSLLPEEEIEKFAIRAIEVWGVGGAEIIQHGLESRENRRKIYNEGIENARMVQDKSAFAKDLKSGLIPGNVYSHLNYVRGRHDFMVDEKHGGYKIDMNYDDL